MHAASVAAQPPPTTPFCAGALVGARTSARSGAFFTFPLTVDGGASPKAAVSPPPPSTSATAPAQHRPFRALPVGARSTEGAGAASPDGCLGGADGGPLLRSRARSGRRSALTSSRAAACAPHLAALPLVGAPTAQPPGATGAVAPRGARAAPTALAPTASVRTGKAAAAAAVTAGVDCPPEPATTVLAAGASARAGLRVGEKSLPPVGVHVAALPGAV